jgi:hypothetical protein
MLYIVPCVESCGNASLTPSTKFCLYVPWDMMIHGVECYTWLGPYNLSLPLLVS